MKQSLAGIDDLVRRTNENMTRKRDYVADVRHAMVTYRDGRHNLMIDDTTEPWEMSDHFTRQLGTWAKIPGNYMQYMKENRPSLLAYNLNNWMADPVHKHTRRLFRGWDRGNWRSFHSDKFNRFDHEHALEAVLPPLEELAEEKGGIKVASSGITDSKMYLKVLFPKTEAEVVGDTVQLGLSISNSEIGMGNIIVMPLIYTLRCTNGMVLPDHGVKKRHVTSRIEGDGNVTFSAETIEADHRAMQLKLKDTVADAVNELKQKEILDELRDAGQSNRVHNPMKAIDKTAEIINLSPSETEKAKLSFVKLGNYSKWGVVSAVTEVANTSESYDRASELEVLGGKVLKFSRKEWDSVALAA